MRTSTVSCKIVGAITSSRSGWGSGENPGGGIRGGQGFGREPSDALGGDDTRTHGRGRCWRRGGPDAQAPFGRGAELLEGGADGGHALKGVRTFISAMVFAMSIVIMPFAVKVRSTANTCSTRSRSKS